MNPENPEETLTVDQQNLDLPEKIEGKFLSFFLAEEEYAIDVLKIIEIMGIQDICSVARAPVHVKGVINIRGKIIPVLDLRIMFDLDAKAFDEKTCIIVTEGTHGGKTIRLGLIVDTVSEVVEVTEENLEQTPEFGGNYKPEHILGIVKSGGTIKTLLNINSILGAGAGNILSQVEGD